MGRYPHQRRLKTDLASWQKTTSRELARRKQVAKF